MEKQSSAPIEPASIGAARNETDQRLTEERNTANREIARRLAGPEQQHRESVADARADVDRSLQRATAGAQAVAERPAVDPSAVHRALEEHQERVNEALSGAPQASEGGAERPGEAAEETLERVQEITARTLAAERSAARTAVAHVAERAAEALSAERRDTDEAAQREREESRGLFQEMLAQERAATDGALRDERKISDALLRNRNDVLALISHDLRNLIGAIAMKSDVLSRRLAQIPSEWMTLAGDILSSSRLMSRLTTDLLDYSSIDAGAFAIQAELQDPADVIGESVRIFAQLAADKGVQLEARVPERLPRARYDRQRILQVLVNLLDNALKFTQTGGAVTVGIEAEGTEIRISVHDTGPGVPEEARASLFERYWYTHDTDRHGSGLGLYISKQIVERHGGRIWLGSEVSRGSTFFFTLPAAE